MLHMPGVVHSSLGLAPDAFQMAKANDDFHFKRLYWNGRAVAHGLSVLLC
jgi:hypothetical protein